VRAEMVFAVLVARTAFAERIVNVLNPEFVVRPHDVVPQIDLINLIERNPKQFNKSLIQF